MGRLGRGVDARDGAPVIVRLRGVRKLIGHSEHPANKGPVYAVMSGAEWRGTLAEIMAWPEARRAIANGAEVIP